MKAFGRIFPRPARTTRITTPNCLECGRILGVQIVIHGSYDGIEDNTWSEEHFHCECGFTIPRNEWRDYRAKALADRAGEGEG